MALSTYFKEHFRECSLNASPGIRLKRLGRNTKLGLKVSPYSQGSPDRRWRHSRRTKTSSRELQALAQQLSCVPSFQRYIARVSPSVYIHTHPVANVSTRAPFFEKKKRFFVFQVEGNVWLLKMIEWSSVDVRGQGCVCVGGHWWF